MKKFLISIIIAVMTFLCVNKVNAKPLNTTQISGGCSVSGICSFIATQALWFDRIKSPIGLEFQTIQTTHSFSVGPLVTVSLFTGDAFRTHFSMGLLFPIVGNGVTSDWFKRNYDFAIAMSAEFKIKENLWLHFRYQHLTPEPFKIFALGDYSRPIVKETAIGGQILVGITANY